MGSAASMLHSRVGMRLLLVTLALAAGCEKNLVAQLPDASPDADLHCAAPTPPLAAGRFVLYLNAEGVTLAKGPTDSATNTSNIVVSGGATVPPFLPGDPNRQVFIDQIVRLVQGALTPYSIDIVTTRPAAGAYYMIVLGGDGMSIAGCPCTGLSESGCYPASYNIVDLVFDTGVSSWGATAYANVVLSQVGNIAGLGNVTDADDCECFYGCPSDRPLCTFSTAATRAAMFSCGGEIIDEPAVLETAFGCR